MTSAKRHKPGPARARVRAGCGGLSISTGLRWVAALLTCACALGGCSDGARREVAVGVHAGAHCPGAALTSAGERRLLALRSGPGARVSPTQRCPYETAATIGRPGEGVFRQPEAVAVAPSGRVYVADQFSHQVQMFSAAGVFEGQWGSAGDGPGEFGAVGGLAIGPHGDVYLVDSTHDR